MVKSRGFKKAKVIVGEVETQNERNIKKIKKKLLNEKLTQEKRDKLNREILYWQNNKPRYSIILEDIF